MRGCAGCKQCRHGVPCATAARAVRPKKARWGRAKRSLGDGPRFGEAIMSRRARVHGQHIRGCGAPGLRPTKAGPDSRPFS